MRLIRHIVHDPALLAGFERLARTTFGLDFAPWRAAGGWDARYRPYVMADGGQVVACAAATLADYAMPGGAQPLRLVQVGTVMTAPVFRGQGLASRLIRAIVADYAQADGFFLFANDGAAGFYPKLGFHRAEETACVLSGSAAVAEAAIPLATDTGTLRRAAALPLRCCFMGPLAQPGLTLFHLMAAEPGSLWRIPGTEAVAVAARDGDVLHLQAVLAPEELPLARIIAAFGPGIRRVALGFTPRGAAGETFPLQEADTTLFVQGPCFEGKAQLPWRFPALCQA